MRELYPGARELFLVRDFRDMIASMRAYNERKGSAISAAAQPRARRSGW